MARTKSIRFSRSGQLELWTAFFAEENRSHCFRPTGVLWLANGGDSFHSCSARNLQRRHKLVHEFLEIRGIQALCRDLDVPPEAVALFEPGCGALLAEESVRAVVESAVRQGLRYVRGKVEPSRAGAGMRSLHIEHGERIEADVFVFACGSWLPKLFPEALGTAIFPTRQECFFFEPAAEKAGTAASLPIWVDQIDPRIPYGFPDLDGAGVKLGSTAQVRDSIPTAGVARWDLTK